MTTETSIYEYAKQGLSHGEDRIAIWFYGRSITYGELFEKIDNVADHLYELGVREGTVVTIHLPNCPQAVMAIYAVAKLGGICNMVHALTPKAAVIDNMRFTESNFLITHLRSCDAETVLTVDPSTYMGTSKTTALDSAFPGVCFEELEKGRPSISTVFPEQDSLARKCVFYLHSSGSTGKPKTIMLNHRAMNHCVENTADFFEKGDMADQVSLCALPLFHGFGLAADIHRNIHFGSKLVMMTRWDPSVAVDLIQKLSVTLIVGVPAMFFSLLREPAFKGKAVSSLRYCYTGGDNVTSELLDRMDRVTGRSQSVLPGFGLTEATTMNCVNTFAHYKRGTAGYPVRNTAIAVLNEDGILRDSGRGELVISSPTLMSGYLKDPDATKKTLFNANGRLWTHTGDEVVIDEEGYLLFKDRIKNIIIHNGYNIYPGEVEEVIRRIPGVKDVCVVGVDDSETGTQNVRAGIIPDAVLTEREIIGECLRCLPRYSVPGEIVFTDRFPTNSMGKIDKLALI